MTISMSDSARKQATASIKRYLAEELEQDVGDLKAGLMLDFFLKEIAPTIYNGAIADAQSDQFAFGIALYEALYRTRPFSKKPLVAP